jgi:hypothetical protein
VIARGPARLLVVPYPYVHELARRFPDVDRQLREAAGDRLQQSAR